MLGFHDHRRRPDSGPYRGGRPDRRRRRLAAGAGANVLTGVSAVSGADVWAVGD